MQLWTSHPLNMILCDQNVGFLWSHTVYISRYPVHIPPFKYHLVFVFNEQYQVTNLKFEFHLGPKAGSMQQFKLSLLIYSNRDLSKEEFSTINKRIDSKRNLHKGGVHISVIKTVLRRLSGTLKASPMGSAARYDIFSSVD